jgi:hypothetical protein
MAFSARYKRECQAQRFCPAWMSALTILHTVSADCAHRVAFLAPMADVGEERVLLVKNLVGLEVPSGFVLEFDVAQSPSDMKLSSQAARSIG